MPGQMSSAPAGRRQAQQRRRAERDDHGDPDVEQPALVGEQALERDARPARLASRASAVRRAAEPAEPGDGIGRGRRSTCAASGGGGHRRATGPRRGRGEAGQQQLPGLGHGRAAPHDVDPPARGAQHRGRGVDVARRGTRRPDPAGRRPVSQESTSSSRATSAGGPPARVGRRPAAGASCGSSRPSTATSAESRAAARMRSEVSAVRSVPWTRARRPGA